MTKSEQRRADELRKQRRAERAGLTKGERVRLAGCALRWMDCQREAAGQCRHCGGPVPCFSVFGDVAPGKRHPFRAVPGLRGA